MIATAQPPSGVPIDPKLQLLLQEHSAYFQMTAQGKVHCLVNSMDLPARMDVVAAFIQ